MADSAEPTEHASVFLQYIAMSDCQSPSDQVLFLKLERKEFVSPSFDNNQEFRNDFCWCQVLHGLCCNRKFEKVFALDTA